MVACLILIISKKKKKNRNGLPFEVLDPIASPEINGYRTKCEFTIGRSPEGDPTVGFLLGLYRHGFTSVLSPDDCLHVPDISKRIANAMQVIIIIVIIHYLIKVHPFSFF